MHDDYRERSEVEMRNQRIDVLPVAPADHHVLRTNRTIKSVYDVTLFGFNSTLLLSFNALLFLSILTTYSRDSYLPSESRKSFKCNTTPVNCHNVALQFLIKRIHDIFYTEWHSRNIACLH